MEIAPDYIQRFKVATAPKSERAEMLERFLTALNPDRERAGFKPMTAAQLAVKLQGIPTGDLYAFYQQCAAARSFGAFFHWALKPKDEANPA